jgi:hypothetical protein
VIKLNTCVLHRNLDPVSRIQQTTFGNIRNLVNLASSTFIVGSRSDTIGEGKGLDSWMNFQWGRETDKEGWRAYENLKTLICYVQSADWVGNIWPIELKSIFFLKKLQASSIVSVYGSSKACSCIWLWNAMNWVFSDLEMAIEYWNIVLHDKFKFLDLWTRYLNVSYEVFCITLNYAFSLCHHFIIVSQQVCSNWI